MYQNYETKKRKARPRGWTRWFMAGLFLLLFGFTGGVLYLLVFMVPIERWLAGLDLSQATVDSIMAALTIGWGAISLLATLLFWRLLLSQKRNLPLAVGALGATFAAAFVTFYFLLDTDLMIAAGDLSEQNVKTERLTFGSYPDVEKLEELEDEGYDGVVTLLNPNIPFEKVLLQREKVNGREVGIPVYSFPMLPWISENDDPLQGIHALVGGSDKRYYIHCYLGKHRVDLVRQEIVPENSISEAPLPAAFERGSLATFDGGRIVLGPYPTDEEWFEYLLRRDVGIIVSTLDPANPEDVPWIEKERRIAEENGMTFVLEPLDPERPDPETVEELTAYAREADGRVYVHDFNVGRRFDAIESSLQRTTTEEEREIAEPAGRE